MLGFWGVVVVVVVVVVVGLVLLVLWASTQVSGSLAEEEEAGDKK